MVHVSAAGNQGDVNSSNECMETKGIERQRKESKGNEKATKGNEKTKRQQKTTKKRKGNEGNNRATGFFLKWSLKSNA